MKKHIAKELQKMAELLSPRLEYGFTGEAYIDKEKKSKMGHFGYRFVNHFHAMKKMAAKNPRKSLIEIFKEYHMINSRKIKEFNLKHPGKFDEIIEEMKKKALDKKVNESLIVDAPLSELITDQPKAQASR